MARRTEELRRRNRTVLAWSLVAAVAIHAAVFLLAPVFHADPLPPGVSPPEEEPAAGFARPILLEVTFGPPRIAGRDGVVRTEPGERVLATRRLVPDQRGCTALARPPENPLRGAVRLRVGSSGRAVSLGVTESTGHACADRVLVEVADALRYHWLPDDRYPAPVDLVQPVGLYETEER